MLGTVTVSNYNNNNNNNTWYCSLTLREKQRLKVFEQMVLRELFELKRDVVTGVWRRLHNEKLHDFCSSPDTITVIKSRIIRLTACGMHGEKTG
jgi:hypothetical protein